MTSLSPDPSVLDQVKLDYQIVVLDFKFIIFGKWETTNQIR